MEIGTGLRWKYRKRRGAKTEGELLYWGEEEYSIGIVDFRLPIAKCGLEKRENGGKRGRGKGRGRGREPGGTRVPEPGILNSELTTNQLLLTKPASQPPLVLHRELQQAVCTVDPQFLRNLETVIIHSLRTEEQLVRNFFARFRFGNRP